MIKIASDLLERQEQRLDLLSGRRDGRGECSLLGELTYMKLGRLNMGFTLFKLLNQGSCWLLCIYSLSSNRGKEEFWIELNDLGNLVEGTWWIGGASTRSYTSEIKMIWIHFSNGKSSIHGSRTIPCLIFHSKIPFSLDPTSDPT